MNRFIKYIILFLLPILLLAFAMEIYLRQIPNNYSYKRNYLDNNSKNIEVLFLGSSHAYYGINPLYVKYNSFNAAMISQSLDYDLKILEKYNGKWDNLKFIVLPVDYLSLFSRVESGIESWRIKNYNIYFEMRSSSSSSSSSKIIDNTEVFSNRLNENYTRIYNYHFNRNTDLSCTKLGFGTEYNSSKNKDLIETGKLAALRHKAKNDLYFSPNTEMLKSIIEFAKKNHIKVIIYTSPAYPTYLQNLDKEQLNRTIAVIIKSVSTYPNIKYYNMIDDKSFDKIDFYDADHLNEIGAKKLTLKMDSLIRLNY